MMKTAALSLLTAGTMFLISPAFAGDKAGDHACCAKTAANSESMCVDYASLNLTADQKSKIETWQAECTKAGCTKESRHAFLKQAKGILSPDQFAKLKEQCKSSKAAKSQA
jgi:hypothetical protein